MKKVINGATVQEQLEQVWKQTGRKPVELEDLVELPDVFNDCWRWFLKLNQTRAAGFGFTKIQYAEMKAYFDLIHIEPEEWEILIIELFDEVASSVFEKEQASKQNKN